MCTIDFRLHALPQGSHRRGGGLGRRALPLNRRSLLADAEALVEGAVLVQLLYQRIQVLSAQAVLALWKGQGEGRAGWAHGGPVLGTRAAGPGSVRAGRPRRAL